MTSRSLSRRTFVFLSAAGAAFAGARRMPAVAQYGRPRAPLGPGFAQDGLAVPIPAAAPPGEGKDRVLVMGGGGEYLAPWLLGYAHALDAAGVKLDLAEAIVGTSAGAFAASTIAGGHFRRLASGSNLFTTIPKLLAPLVPPEKHNAGQLRAKNVLANAKDATAGTIQGIGRAAMAARNGDTAGLQRTISFMTENRDWPSPAFHATAVDCYSGERLVVSQGSLIPVAQAVCASMSVPGSVGPTWLDNRFAMDGGACGTSTHCDLVAGAKRALIFTANDGTPGGPRLSSIPSTFVQEIAALNAGGTRTMVITPGSATFSLVTKGQILAAIKAGFARGQGDAGKIKAFWG